MAQKKGLLATLSSIALSAGVATAQAAAPHSDVMDPKRFVELCDWIHHQNDVQELQTIISRLARNDQECYFDPVTGRDYCNACLTLAAQRLVSLTATAAGGYSFQ